MKGESCFVLISTSNIEKTTPIVKGESRQVLIHTSIIAKNYSYCERWKSFFVIISYFNIANYSYCESWKSLCINSFLNIANKLLLLKSYILKSVTLKKYIIYRWKVKGAMIYFLIQQSKNYFYLKKPITISLFYLLPLLSSICVHFCGIKVASNYRGQTGGQNN